MAPDGTAFWSSKPRSNSDSNARDHALEHAQEFGVSESSYRTKARDFVSAPPLTTECFTRDNGEVMIYDPMTNTFAVRTPEGAPATMFKPVNGLKYWITQLRKFGGERA